MQARAKMTTSVAEVVVSPATPISHGRIAAAAGDQQRMKQRIGFMASLEAQDPLAHQTRAGAASGQGTSTDRSRPATRTAGRWR